MLFRSIAFTPLRYSILFHSILFYSSVSGISIQLIIVYCTLYLVLRSNYFDTKQNANYLDLIAAKGGIKISSESVNEKNLEFKVSISTATCTFKISLLNVTGKPAVRSQTQFDRQATTSPQASEATKKQVVVNFLNNVSMLV